MNYKAGDAVTVRFYGEARKGQVTRISAGGVVWVALEPKAGHRQFAAKPFHPESLTKA